MRAGRVWIRKAALARSFCSFFKLADLLIADSEIFARNTYRVTGKPELMPLVRTLSDAGPEVGLGDMWGC